MKFERNMYVSEKKDGKERQKEGEESAEEDSGGGKSWSCQDSGGKLLRFYTYETFIDKLLKIF